MSEIEMTSSRPYLVRALYEWIVDNNLTPHLLVDTHDERVRVPREFVKDHQIVLNVAPRAVGQFAWDNERIEFSARFGGTPRNLSIPMWAILSVYARENGAGMALGQVEIPRSESAQDAAPDTTTTALERAQISGVTSSAPAALKSVAAKEDLSENEIEASKKTGADGDNNPEPPTPRPTKRPSLKVVK